MNILIIEDEPKVVSFIKKGLEEAGYNISIAYDGDTGERMIKNHQYEMYILDLMLPFKNGYELCRIIRKYNPRVPILMLSALGSTDDKLKGFDNGADDYLVKPFDFLELLARIKALTKRYQYNNEINQSLVVGDLELDLDKKVANRSGNKINLTSKEFLLLELLMKNKGKVVSREMISEKVWEITFDTGTNVVDVYINLLRKKIDKGFDHKFIQTKVGMGYMIDN